MASNSLQIGEVAKRAGVSVDTVRFYETRGLLHSVSRTRGGFRLFHPNTIERIGFIKQAQEFGLSLDDIGELLRSGGVDECRRMRDLLKRKVDEVDDQLRRMRAFRKTLLRHLAACDHELKENGRDAVCPAVHELGSEC